MWVVIADWDASMVVTRYNYTEEKDEAIRLVSRLRGGKPSAKREAEMQKLLDDPKESFGKKTWARKEQQPLPLEKQAPNTYYAEIIAPDEDCAECLHLSPMWDCDPINKTVSFNTVRLAARHRKRHMFRLREERNQLLLQSDVNILPDRWNSMDVATQTQWATYRQELRDLPAEAVDPANPTWPTQPE